MEVYVSALLVTTSSPDCIKTFILQKFKLLYAKWFSIFADRTLSEVAGGADRNDDVIESGSVWRREVGVRALTLFDHLALIARLLTRLTVTDCVQKLYCTIACFADTSILLKYIFSSVFCLWETEST